VTARDDAFEPITVIVHDPSGAAGAPVWHGGGVECGRLRTPASRPRDLVGARGRPSIPRAAVLDSLVTGRRL